jgi:hypothetical protein
MSRHATEGMKKRVGVSREPSASKPSEHAHGTWQKRARRREGR